MRVIFSCFSIFYNSIKSKGKSFSWTATNGAHTHDFKIVSLTRCRLCHGHVHCLLILWHFLSAPNILVSAQKFSFFLPKLIKNINWTVFMWTSLAFVTFFLRDCGKLWCFKGLIFNWTNNNQLVLNGLVDYLFSLLFFSCLLIFHNSIKSEGKFFPWTATCEARTHALKKMRL